MRALVTGACGFVGGYMAEHLLACGDSVLGTFLHERPRLSCDLVQLDITSADACARVVQSYKPDVVFHLAGMAFVPDAEKNFAHALSINVGGTYNMLAGAASLKQPVTFVLISSAQVYGRINPAHLPLTEQTPPAPADNYSLSKIMAELVTERFRGNSDIRSIIMRPFNHIGAGQRVEFAVSSFGYQLAEIAKKTRAPVLKVGNLDARRDFTDVRDIVRGYRLAALKGQGVYNLCSGEPVSMRSILETLIEISGLKIAVELDPQRLRPSDTPDLYGCAAKAQKDLGWKPEHALRSSLESVYKYWLESSSPIR
ncbi:MAG: GDP-mannose 4,6-dehydratase [Oligoflexia bacterium]|nr:GDP-mannose 4,6-dehydratase [Oligoflexia bacterium]